MKVGAPAVSPVKQRRQTLVSFRHAVTVGLNGLRAEGIHVPRLSQKFMTEINKERTNPKEMLKMKIDPAMYMKTMIT
jgi:hypothetical protein